MFRGIKSLAVLLCSAMLLASFDLSAARFYKSVDENGKVTFSDRPASATAEQLEVQVFTPDVPPPPVPTLQKPADNANQGGDAAAAGGDQASGEAQEDLKALQEKRDKNCKQAKNQLHQLQNISRLYSQDENGDRSYITDEDRVVKIAAARKSISEWCKK